MHDVPSVETQRQRYSRQLAEYTLLQWNIARQALERTKTQDKPSSPSDRSSESSSRDHERFSRTSQGIQPIDFATRSHNGVRFGGRTIIAGSA
ncbi:uncharacterized protein LAESUDRAFT_192886 [Laetiporus sulphureus 93-53]|uniref:Uncharacterized protein n=1 Tax=Laetiporus sulphureus 93-53 TaxID=1314785 RepID=A0A165E723_9APHY|nr:uncharacterized protein LAESUDRAFT_192886 [Laetiporus sulphureus 93-53]KZT06364.1 hypothetical protein LAESUDRAFT_192886 [Laetiporus sulphureus 93-53]